MIFAGIILFIRRLIREIANALLRNCCVHVLFFRLRCLIDEQTIILLLFYYSLNFLPHIPENNIGSQQLDQLLREFISKADILCVEELLVDVEQDLILI